MTDELTPLARLAARNEWQGGNRGGVTMAFRPKPPACLYGHDPCPVDAPWHCECRAWLDTWQDKMRPDVFDLNGKVRRAYRTSYGERLALQVTVILGVLAGCAIVWAVVWGVMG